MPRRPDVPCAGCGALIWRGTGCLPPGQAMCRSCVKELRPKQPCGTIASYRRGCRCSDCRAASAAAMKAYAQKRKGEGRPLPRHPNRGNRYNITEAQRLAIYQRDEWTCQICREPVPRGVHYNDPLAPTLDHIEPQSLALIPNHDPTNLRLAHRVCNAKRGPGRPIAAAATE